MRHLLPLTLLTAACYAPPMEMVDPAAPQPQPDAPKPVAPVAPKIVCDMAKFSFTQDVGCVNDGWVEFCAEKAGAPVVTALRALSPGISITEGVIGRAGCNEATEYFVSHPLEAKDCTQHFGALTNSAWDTLCALSQVPETKHFVPGFGE